MSVANVPVPKAPNEIKEPVLSDHESDTPSVAIEEAEVFVNRATNIPGGQAVIRAEVHTSSAVLQETKLYTKPEKNPQAQSENQPPEEAIESKIAPSIVEERPADQKAASTEIMVDIEDIEDQETTANTAGNVSTPEESPESTTKQNQDQKITPAQDGNDTCTPMTTIVNADDGNDDTTEMTAQNANAMEREKRLSALKDAWESQDKEDVAYLKIVL